MPRKKAETPAAAPEEKITEHSQAETQPEAPEDTLEAGAGVQAAPEEDSPAETAPAGRPAVVRSPKGLNLREGPALSYEVREVLPDGTEVTALDLPMGTEVPGWRLVSAGQEGAPAGAQRSGSGGESRREWSGADVRQSRTERSGIPDGVGWCQSRFLRLEG